MSYQLMEGRKEDCSAASADTKAESFACSDLPQIPGKKKKKNINNNRRFNDEQIRLLESIFESETKLEPRKKMQLARELGLQPRQIAIWFQNRRARWKSKQIEQQYKTLRNSYDNLASRFESLKNEKQSLLLELQKLHELLGSPCDGNRSCREPEGSNKGIGSVDGNTRYEAEAQEGLDSNNNRVVFTSSQNDNSKHSGHFGDEEHNFLNRSEYTDVSLATPDQRWYSFDSPGQLDMTCSSNSSQWFDFWT